MPNRDNAESKRRLRDSCHFFISCSLDSIANDYATHCKATEKHLPDEAAIRDLARRTVSSKLSTLSAGIKDMTERDVINDIAAGSQAIRLGKKEKPIKSITLDNVLDIIEGALETQRDMVGQEEGDYTIIRHAPEIGISIPAPAEEHAARSYNATVITLKNLREARKSFYRQADAYAVPGSGAASAETLKMAAQNWEEDVEHIRAIPAILKKARQQLCREETLGQKVLGDLIDVVLYEFNSSVKPDIPRPPRRGRGR